MKRIIMDYEIRELFVFKIITSASLRVYCNGKTYEITPTRDIIIEHPNNPDKLVYDY
jgi:hypothetical protein